MATRASGSDANEAMRAALRELAAALPGLRGRDAGALIAKLRAAAIAEGRAPVAELADGFAAALIGDRDGTPVSSWIEALGHAAAIGPADRAASQLLLATVGVRLAH